MFGVTHIPRLEDWPVMPVERIGFMLMVLQYFQFDSIFNLILLSFPLGVTFCLLL